MYVCSKWQLWWWPSKINDINFDYQQCWCQSYCDHISDVNAFLLMCVCIMHVLCADMDMCVSVCLVLLRVFCHNDVTWMLSRLFKHWQVYWLKHVAWSEPDCKCLDSRYPSTNIHMYNRHKHAYIHTYIHTYMHIYMHVHTHIFTYVRYVYIGCV